MITSSQRISEKLADSRAALGGLQNGYSTPRRTQAWAIGARVNVGFLKDLLVTDHVPGLHTYRLVNERTGTRYRLSDRVRVQVVRVDLETNKIDFRLIEGPAKPTERSGKTTSLVARWTPIWRLKGGKWIIVHDHFSASLESARQQ